MRQGASILRQRTRPSVTRSTRWKIGLTGVMSVVLLALALRQADLEVLGRSLVQANYVHVAGAVATYFVDLGFRSVRWSILLRGTRATSPWRLYPVVAIGYVANNLLPARIGELSRAYLVGRRDGVSPSTVLASIAIERVVDGLTVLVLLVLALPALPMVPWLGRLIQLAAVTLWGSVAGYLVLAVARPAWIGAVARLLQRLPGHLGNRAAHLGPVCKGVGHNQKRIAAITHIAR